MNPCKCGYFQDPVKKCICSNWQIQQYQKKISGPLLDRFDMRIFMGQNDPTESHNINYYEKIIASLQFQNQRNIHNIPNNNLQQNSIELLNFCPEALNLVHNFCEKNLLSMRRKLKILGVARSLGDWDLSEQVKTHHCLEAIFLTSKMDYGFHH
jgi:magnesium chelatase family protein